LKKELLGGTAVPLSHRVPKIEFPVMVGQALDERRLLQSLQMILGSDVAENLPQLSSVWVGVCKGAKAELPLENSTLR